MDETEANTSSPDLPRSADSSLRSGSLALVLVLSALASGIGTGSAVGPLLALFATAMLLWPGLRRSVDSLPRAALPAVVIAGGLSPYLLGTTYWSVALLLALLGVVVAYVTLGTPRVGAIALVLHSLISLVVLFAVMPAETIDVWFLHDQTGAVVRAGGNPWTDLAIPNGAPGPDQDFITGYPYPPLVLGLYAVAGTMLGEPRLITATALVAIAAIFAVHSLRDRRWLITGWALCLQPAWALMLWSGWTEPLSVAIAVLAWAVWHRLPTLRAWLFGLLLASKQYFIAVGVLVLRARSFTTTENAVALGTAAFAAGVALAWGWRDAYEALVVFHTQQPPRADGLTLYGLFAAFGVELPSVSWLPVVASGLAALAVGRSAGDRESTYLASAAVLATFFVLGSQAFANYWFVVLALALLGQRAESTRAEAGT